MLDEINKNKTITIQELLTKLKDNFKDEIQYIYFHYLKIKGSKNFYN